MVYSTRRFVVSGSVCHFVLVFFSPFSIAITSFGDERANLSAFRTLVRFVLVWICRFPLPLGVWEELRFVIVALPGLFSYLFLRNIDNPTEFQLNEANLSHTEAPFWDLHNHYLMILLHLNLSHRKAFDFVIVLKYPGFRQ